MSAPLHQRRADQELSELKARVGRIGARVRRAVEQAVHGVLEGDEDTLYDVMLGDHPINREVRKLDAATHAFVAVHQPAATSLRTVSSILRLNIALERVGDYAVTIGRAGVHLDSQPPAWLATGLEELGRESVRMLDLSVRAFVEDDTELARRTMDMARAIDALHDGLFARITGGELDQPVAELVRWLTVAGRLERVSDQAKNLCEEAVFAATGTTGPKRLYRILFADAEDGLASRLAAAVGIERYAQVASFDSASWSPAASAHPLLTAAGVARVDTSAPRPLPDLRTARYDVVIALSPGGAQAIGRLPFHTVRQTWDLGADDVDIEDVIREIETRLDGLMELLCEDPGKPAGRAHSPEVESP